MARSVHTAHDTTSLDLRAFMAGFPTGVAVLTTLDADGHPWGMTCTSIASVALAPPTLLVCLRLGSPTLQALRTAGAFALNLLQHASQATAELFASGAEDRFTRTEWQLPAEAGGPHLRAAAHTIADCSVAGIQPVGDHAVVFGDVRRVAGVDDPDPLLYGLRRYAPWPGGERWQP
ncbi:MULTISPECIES: flavin reductase family protein [Streptomyces]|uniref:Flavin reductase n=1 Tax=Streptomyces olivaceus TaxID=47716 RepID=A0A3G8G7K5_STROV|nr:MULTISPECIES: flavin reductase family protein [Streptomyces]AZG02889.1 flavin reductase [Streptomyces olivaceus]MBZ6172062.1 flavin reductase family protein [Streptomyces olivaceus]MBZ6181116.1 flavin reductase family protein [Streptomyces olivaceus]MCM8554643.1 flavin reductase family protein [Streptomyces sp. STCH 565 A]WFB84916.1 flavin reductase family protein [Streptomyces olivaceus]